MRTACLTVWCAFVIAVVTAQVWAQTTAAVPAFETVSVKPNRSPEQMMTSSSSPSGFVARNMPLAFLIMNAYQVHSDYILHAPGWIHTERFDVEAKVAAQHQARDRATSRAMLQSLLADRFKLSVREVPRSTQGYSLVLARTDGRLGAQLRASSVSCEQDAVNCFLRGADGEARGRGIAVWQLAGHLGLTLGAVVGDKTGLVGVYDFELAWTPDRRSAPLLDAASEPLTDRGSLFTAVVEQLGLRLQPAAISERSIVIERVERPTPN